MLKTVHTWRRKNIKAQQTCRKIYITILEKWVLSRDSGFDEKAYEFLCLLLIIPKVIYNKNISDNKLKHVLKEISKDQFAIKNFIEVCSKLQQENNNNNNGINNNYSEIQRKIKVDKLIEGGKIAKAYNLLTRENSSNNIINESTIEELKRLNPNRRDPTQFITLDDQMLQFTEEEIKNTIHKLKRDKAPGLSQFTTEMIQDLISNDKNNNDSIQFLFYFTKFINNYADGVLPGKFYNLVHNSRLIPIKKSSGGIRPIVLIELFDKIAGSTFLSRINITNRISEIFKPLQVGIKTRSAIEIVNKLLEIKKIQNPELDIVALDFKNAYNNISRTTILNELKKFFPEIYNWQIKQLNNSTRLWVKMDDYEENIGFIRSKEGVHQGSSLGPLMFALALNPILQQVNKIITLDNSNGKNSVVMSYLDDTNLMSDTDRLIKAVDFVIKEGPKVGLILNPEKTIVCIGNHIDNINSAQKWKQKFNLDPVGNHNNIKIPSESTNYGFNCLGSPWGNKDYIIKQLNDIFNDIKKDFEKMEELNKCQYKWLMLSYIIQNKINHLQRSIKLEIMIKFSEEMNSMILEFIKRLLKTDSNLDQYAIQKCFLKLNVGGLGLQNQIYKNISASLASFIYSFSYLKCNNYLEDDLSNNYMNEDGNKLISKFFQLVNIPSNTAATFDDNLNHLYKFMYKDQSDMIIDDSIYSNFIVKNKIQATLYESINNNELIRVENSLEQNSDRLIKFKSNKSSKFISRMYKILPKHPLHRIDNSVWISNTNIILDRDIGNFPHIQSNNDSNNEEFFVTCPICITEINQRINDNKGHHQANCSANSFSRKTMHDKILKALIDLLKSAGISALKEPTDVLTKPGNNGDILIPDIFIANNPLVEDNLNSVYDLFVVHPSNHGLVSKAHYKIAKYNQAIEISNGSTIFIPIGFDLYGELGPETDKFIENIASFGCTSKGYKQSYFLNRFYNNLSFIFANENTNIIKSYIYKYGEFRSRNSNNIS